MEAIDGDNGVEEDDGGEDKLHRRAMRRVLALPAVLLHVFVPCESRIIGHRVVLVRELSLVLTAVEESRDHPDPVQINLPACAHC